MSKLLALLALVSVPAAAQTVRAPALGRSSLPGMSALSAAASGLSAVAARPLPAPAAPAAPSLLRPALPAVALPAPAPAPAPAAAAVMTPRASLEAAAAPLARAADSPSLQAPVLEGLFEGRRLAPAAAVFAEPSAARPSLLSAANRAAAAQDPAPPPPARPAWKTAGLYALRTAGFLGALYGGFRVGDMVYLGAGFLGGWGLLVSLPALGAAAWWLGRRPDASPLGRSVMGGLFGSMGLVVVGQQVWDLVHTPWGLLVGVPVGVALALVASGLLPRRRKFTAEPPNLDPRRPQG